ncbi:cyclic pyranopterin monophosphate synthase subunit MoaA [Neolewinella xylanilytica]|uniref:GTP 3',8-cyclase n=1 Tax=Neolewinella xylanilytica TaxID=1514080 RepID=A0A2S6I4L9_9BACT|nr:GTP 3',8-cyclase MoaA [Neolewinella xylanilytica]PPK86117.1 cyclic pyranopterin monophosphate synthase subunit MoaA [Neolewinella xylanilytica]
MLLDQHGRQIKYLRLAVTDRCNLRCRYCMPEEGIAFADREALLTYDEILLFCGVLAEMGVEKVRLTGGEPLVRRELTTLVAGLNKQFPKLAMTTNGLLLPRYLDELMEHGLRTYNLSLDTLRPERFERITRRDNFAGTYNALEMLLERGCRTKINVVVMRGINDDELYDFVELTRDNDLDVRFIEAMPFNDDDGNHDVFLSYDSMRLRLLERYPDLSQNERQGGSAVTFSVPGYRGNVAIIPAYSRSLCGTCDRLRITPRGTLLNCLYSTRGLELLPLLRSGIDRDDLATLIREFVYGKYASGHETERREQQGNIFASMTSIGG